MTRRIAAFFAEAVLWALGALLLGVLIADVVGAAPSGERSGECLTLDEARANSSGYPRYRLVEGRKCWCTSLAQCSALRKPGKSFRRKPEQREREKPPQPETIEAREPAPPAPVIPRTSEPATTSEGRGINYSVDRAIHEPTVRPASAETLTRRTIPMPPPRRSGWPVALLSACAITGLIVFLWQFIYPMPKTARRNS